MIVRKLWTLAGVSALFLVGCVTPAQMQDASPATEATQQPNILFILIDDLGYGDLGVTGMDRVGTPNIDALAQSGMLMTQFYMGAPICSPSRAAFMTGRFPAELGFVSFISSREHNIVMDQTDWLDPALPNLPRGLRDAGYRTGRFGKWHLRGGRDIGDAPLPGAYGFDASYTQFEGLGPRALFNEDHYSLVTALLTGSTSPKRPRNISMRR